MVNVRINEFSLLFRSKGIIILETYTTERGKLDLPKFIEVVSEITGERRFSMHTLSKLNSESEASS